jgi:hypothetical protein
MTRSHELAYSRQDAVLYMLASYPWASQKSVFVYLVYSLNIIVVAYYYNTDLGLHLSQGADEITYFSLHGDTIHVPDPEMQLVSFSFWFLMHVIHLH